MSASRLRAVARLWAAVASMLATALSAPASAAAPYATDGQCAGFPRVALTTPDGWCVGLVASAADGLVFPRRLLEVAPGRFWLVDMGGWQPGRGRVLQFELPAGSSAAPTLRVVADKLDRPHGIALGADGLVYVAEAGRVWRTPVAVPAVVDTVLAQLPADGSHPLKEIVFGAPGQLFVNVGSASDACRTADDTLPLPCPERAGATPRAAVYEALLGAGTAAAVRAWRPYATGLRNSLALAWVPPGVLLQGENAIDYSDDNAPPDELNVLVRGADYGWPYCLGARLPARGYEGRVDCSTTAAPALVWPAHVAPLQMVAVPAAANNAFAGQLLVAWHSYRKAGHRVVSYALDARGRPVGRPHVWLDGWSALKNVRPLGAPAGILVDSAGRLLVVEDRNRTVLLLTRDTGTRAGPSASTPASTPASATAAAPAATRLSAPAPKQALQTD